VTLEFFKGYYILAKTSVSDLCQMRQSIINKKRAQSSMYNGKSRHICLIHNTIKQLLSNEIVSIVKSNKNIAELKGFRERFYIIHQGEHTQNI